VLACFPKQRRAKQRNNISDDEMREEKNKQRLTKMQILIESARARTTSLKKACARELTESTKPSLLAGGWRLTSIQSQPSACTWVSKEG
jgi:hypothetical protein